MGKGRGAARKLSTELAKNEYAPLPGFTERIPGVWMPQHHYPNDFEIAAPRIENDEEAAVEYLRCQRSLPHFAFRHCWSLHTDDPGGMPMYRKFPVYPYLVDFFKRVQEPSNIHIEKSRQLLMSWAWMCVFLWDITFHDAWANLAISRKEILVDDGAGKATTDCLFGKFLVLWRSLPPYLQAQMEFKHLRITCPSTNSYVKGESGATNGGRGASYKRALLDEAAHIPKGETLFRAVHEAAKKGLALNSTPMGKGNVFARIRFQPRTTFQRVSYHWTMHPEKAVGIYCQCGWHSDPQEGHFRDQYQRHHCIPPIDPTEKIERKPRSPWYDVATSDYTPEQIASEFDLSYEKSMRGRVFEAFDETRHVWDYQDVQYGGIGPKKDSESAAKYRERYLRRFLVKGLTPVVGWDFGVSDPTSLCLGQVIDERNMKIRWLDEYQTNNQSWRHYRKFVNGLWRPIVKEVTGLDIMHYGDPSGKNRGADLTSWVSNLAQEAPEHDPEKLGKPVHMTTKPNQGDVVPWCDFVNDLIRRNQFEVSLWAQNMIDALGQYHFPLDSEGNPVPGDHLPVHDEWSHPMSAMRYVYQIRWNGRLKDVDNAGTSIDAMLADDDEGRIPPAPMF